MKLLMIDNYDSFTWNLVHLFEELGAERGGRSQRRDHGRGGRGASSRTGSSSRPAPDDPRMRASPSR